MLTQTIFTSKPAYNPLRVYSNWELPVYQVIGPVVRVHWDYQMVLEEIENQDPIEHWSAMEVVLPVDCDRETFVTAVKALNGPSRALADGWFDIAI